jgi:hypothetical protein
MDIWYIALLYVNWLLDGEGHLVEDPDGGLGID